MSDSKLVGKRIAIIGGGPAGLTLARLLQMQGLVVRVFERDSARDARLQGGSLDLHENGGQLAIRRCELWQQFQAVARPEGQETRVFDKAGRMHVAVRGDQEAQSSPEIDRGVLRDLLLCSLEPGTVQWAKEVDRVSALEVAQQRVSFRDGSHYDCDLLIGCDGVWSKIRRLVSDDEPAYCGITFVETRLVEVDSRHPEVARLVGPGSALCLGDDKALMAQRNGDGSVRLYAARRLSELEATQDSVTYEPREPACCRGSRIGHRSCRPCCCFQTAVSMPGPCIRCRRLTVGPRDLTSLFSAMLRT